MNETVPSRSVSRSLWRLPAMLCVICLSASVGIAVGEEAPKPHHSENHAEPKPAALAPPAAVMNVAAKTTDAKLVADLPVSANLHASAQPRLNPTEEYETQLNLGRNLRQEKDWQQAEQVLGKLAQSLAPISLKRDALIELGLIAEESQNLVRAQQVYAQFLAMFPDDPVGPEIYLRQGLIYRQMGAPNMALGKFYAVMSMALNLKQDNLQHYQYLVLRAQTEIADTYYLRGSYQEAADFFKRLLKLQDESLNKPQIAGKLIRTLSALQRNEETVAQANLFLESYPESADIAEIRFLLADTLRRLGRNNEATTQVMTLLSGQQSQAGAQPELWRYWQQRTGNEIGNQLYKNGDYLNALEIYSRLTELDSSPVWQAPLFYQIGLANEKLEQSARAANAYQKVLDVSTALGTNATPAVNLVVDMSRWRLGQIKWSTNSTLRAASITTNISATATSPVTQ